MSRTPAANGITASLSLVFIPLWDFLFTKAHSGAAILQLGAVSGDGQMVVGQRKGFKINNFFLDWAVFSVKS